MLIIPRFLDFYPFSLFLTSFNSSLNNPYDFKQAIFLKVLLLSRLRNFIIIRALWLKNRSLKAEEAGIPRYFWAILSLIEEV
jgi:hypothetical protein